MRVVNHAGPHALALETTVLVHGVPLGQATALAEDLRAIARREGASPAFVGVMRGIPTVGLTDEAVSDLISAAGKSIGVPKANTANLGVFLHRAVHAATTVSATMEIAAAAGVRVFSTGGIGGVHLGFADSLDISSDLAAFTRFPVAVISSGVKSILNVEATREALETLGVPVVGFQTHHFPAFYLRESAARVDARFNEVADLAAFLDAELKRTGRGVLVCNPIPAADEVDPLAWSGWLADAIARARVGGASGRDITPRVLAHLHQNSGGATLRANLALLRSNVALGARLAAVIG